MKFLRSVDAKGMRNVNCPDTPVKDLMRQNTRHKLGSYVPDLIDGSHHSIICLKLCAVRVIHLHCPVNRTASSRNKLFSVNFAPSRLQPAQYSHMMYIYCSNLRSHRQELKLRPGKGNSHVLE